MLADTFNYVTPYNYAENSPVANIDLWGTQRYPAQPYLGFAMWDKEGYSNLVDRQNKALKTASTSLKEGTWSVGVTGTFCPGVGFTAEVGILVSEGNIEKLYFDGGMAWGADISGGLNFTYYKPKQETLSGKNKISDTKAVSVEDIKGWGEGYNLGIYYFDFGMGGNSIYPGFNPENYRDYHSKYNSYNFGVSVGAPFGFTKSKEWTIWVISFDKDRNK